MKTKSPIAKLCAPRLFDVVQRTRLFERLDDNRGRPLIWLESPPGAGKTTLVASYLEARHVPTLWYQIDSGDDDPASVFFYLAQAALTLVARDEINLPRMVADQQLDLEAFARSFFRDLFAELPAGTVLVLDNYQDLSVDSQTQEVFRAAVAQVPPSSSIICISRAAPAPNVAALIGTGALWVLRWDSIRLSLDETRGLAKTRQIDDDHLVQAIHSQSEGWAAGTTLILERLAQVGNDEGLIPALGHEATFDYFASLIFSRLRDADIHVLLSVAFLPAVRVDIACMLSENEQAGAVLEELHHRRLFIDRRSGSDTTYVFHALFQDFLKRQVRDRFGKPRAVALMLRSGAFLEEARQIESAISVFLLAEAWSHAARLLLTEAQALIESGRRDTLIQWINRLPEDERTAQPRLIYWLGVAQAITIPKVGLVTLKAALAELRAVDDSVWRLYCLCDLLRVASIGYYAVDAMDEWLEELLALLPEPDAFAMSVEEELRIWGVLCSALMLVRPWHPWVRIAPRKVYQLLNDSANPTLAVAAGESALEMATHKDSFEFCDQLVLRVKPFLGAANLSPAVAFWWHIQVAYLRFHQGDDAAADIQAQRARSIAQAYAMTSLLPHAVLFQTMWRFRRCGWATASVFLREAENLVVPGHIMQHAYVTMYQAREAQHYGNQPRATELAMAAFGSIRRATSPHHVLVWGVLVAEVLIAAGDVKQARLLIVGSKDILLRSLDMHDSQLSMMSLAEAYIAWAEGALNESVALLNEALRYAKEGTRRHFLRFQDNAMRTLFPIALAHGIEVETVRQIIRMFHLSPPPDAPDNWPWHCRIRTLGAFDIRLDDKPLMYARKLPRKTLALLKVLIVHGGKDISEGVLCDALWPDDEADAAREALKITVIRLRKLLANGDCIKQSGGKVSMDPGYFWVDAWAFEKRLAQGPTQDRPALLDLYQGNFLPEDADETWSVTARERMRGKFVHLLATHGISLEAQGEYEHAIALYYRGIDADAVVEAFHQGLMRCYQAQGRHTEVIAAFRRMRQMLSAAIGVAPSLESRRLCDVSIQACGYAG